MVVSCILNGYKRVFLWTISCYPHMVAIAVISRVVFIKSCDFKGVDLRKRDILPYNGDILSPLPGVLCGMALRTLSLKMPILCVALIACGVFLGLLECHWLDLEIKKENNKLLSLIPSRPSLMDRFCSFKTPEEAMEFHNTNNKLIANGNRKVAIQACRHYMKDHQLAGALDSNIASMIRLALKRKNYSVLFCLFLLAGDCGSLRALGVVEDCDLEKYRLMLDFFDREQVKFLILEMLFISHPRDKVLHSFWLKEFKLIQSTDMIRQLRAREIGAFRQLNRKIDESVLNKLIETATHLQKTDSLKRLLDCGACLRKIQCLEILFQRHGVNVNLQYFMMLVKNGAEPFNDMGYSPINTLLRKINEAAIWIHEDSVVSKVLEHLIKAGAKYDARAVPLYLVTRMSGWARS